MVKLYKYKGDIIMCNNPDRCLFHYNFNENKVFTHLGGMLYNHVEEFKGKVILKSNKKKILSSEISGVKYIVCKDGYVVWISGNKLRFSKQNWDVTGNNSWTKNCDEVNTLTFFNR